MSFKESLCIGISLLFLHGCGSRITDEKIVQKQSETSQENEVETKILGNDEKSSPDKDRISPSDQLRIAGECTGCDLSGTSLTGEIFTHAQLSESSLTGSDLSDSDFQLANLIRTDFSRANINRANLARANLTRSQFAAAKMDEVDLSYANLHQAMMPDVKGDQVKLVGANLKQAIFTDATLPLADFTGANLNKADGSRADLSNSVMRSLRGQDIRLVKAKLNGVIFDDSNLAYADFSGAVGRQITFISSNLEGVRLDGADIDSASFKSARLNNSFLTGASLRDVDFSGADLSNSDLSGAKLLGASIFDANFENVNFSGAEVSDLKGSVGDLLHLAYQFGAEPLPKELKNLLKIRKKRRENEASRFGHRSLKLGLHADEIKALGICDELFLAVHQPEVFRWGKCFDDDNYRFQGAYKDRILTRLIIELVLSDPNRQFPNRTIEAYGDGNKTKSHTVNFIKDIEKSLNSQFDRDFSYSDKDLNLFNKEDIKNLYTVYAGGQVVLAIRKPREYASNLRVFIEYREPNDARDFLRAHLPVNLNQSSY